MPSSTGSFDMRSLLKAQVRLQEIISLEADRRKSAIESGEEDGAVLAFRLGYIGGLQAAEGVLIGLTEDEKCRETALFSAGHTKGLHEALAIVAGQAKESQECANEVLT